jgi:hypothetical protein
MDTEHVCSAFVKRIREFAWLSHAGESYAGGRVIADVQAAWDVENHNMLRTWEPHIHELEANAKRVLGDQTIDLVFSGISSTIHESVYRGICAYFKRAYGNAGVDGDTLQRSVVESLYPEFIDAVKRDVCWAAVENAIGAPGFFTRLLEIYETGRWPCAWDDRYPQGSPVVL